MTEIRSITANHVVASIARGNCSWGGVQGKIDRVKESIVRLEDSVEADLPDANACTWLTNELKIAFFVLVCLISEYDFLLAI